MTEKTTYYSDDESEFHSYTDPDECASDFLSNCLEVAVGDEFTIYAGEGAPVNGSTYLDDIADTLTNGAYDNVGEGVEDWCYDIDKIGKELQVAVERAVDAVLDKHKLQPNFCSLTSLPPLKYRRTVDGVERVHDEQNK